MGVGVENRVALAGCGRPEAVRAYRARCPPAAERPARFPPRCCSGYADCEAPRDRTVPIRPHRRRRRSSARPPMRRSPAKPPALIGFPEQAQEIAGGQIAASCSRETPLMAANTRAVCATFAGSLRLPRTGTGARYGASVSTSSRSSGRSRAMARNSSDFGKVRMPEKLTIAAHLHPGFASCRATS